MKFFRNKFYFYASTLAHLRGERQSVRFVSALAARYTVAMELGKATPATVAKPRNWPRLTLVSVGSVVLWLMEFAYQYYIYEPGVIETAWVRSHSLTGTTLIALALFSSALFKWLPRTASYWRVRRYLGVAGFVFIFFHVAGALRYYFGFNLAAVFFTWNPFHNPVVFGALAYPVLLGLAITSSDWMVRRLGKWWKFIHRFIYLAEVGIIFHVLLIGGPVMNTLPGYLLYAVGGAAIFGQVYRWVRVSAQRRFRNAGFYVGLGIIALAAALVYIAVRYYGWLQ